MIVTRVPIVVNSPVHWEWMRDQRNPEQPRLRMLWNIVGPFNPRENPVPPVAMHHETTRDRDLLEDYLRRDAPSHVYGLADLDPYFWDQTTWFAAVDEMGVVQAACALLSELDPPILYAVSKPGDPATGRLLEDLVVPALPDTVVADLGLGLTPALEQRFALHVYGELIKMYLPEPDLTPVGSHAVDRLSMSDLNELEEFYDERAYDAEEGAGRFFAPYMMDLGPFFGIRRGGLLVAAGGVHVVSRRYRVAALANIATSPRFRGQGLATSITSALCRDLAPYVDTIGLNVHADNRPAIGCYTKLGFREAGRYLEVLLTRRS